LRSKYSYSPFLNRAVLVVPPRSELSSIIDNPSQLIPRCHVLQMRSLPCFFPSSKTEYTDYQCVSFRCCKHVTNSNISI
jgi:hypothetical protein